MKKVKLLSLILVLLFVVGCTQTKELKTGTFNGKITGKKSGNPLPNICVFLCKPLDASDSEPICEIDGKLSAISDSKGLLTINNVPAGLYIIILNFNSSNQQAPDPNQFDKMKVHYTWPATRINKNTGELIPIDIFGGNKGYTSTTENDISLQAMEKVYQGEKSVYLYPFNGLIVSNEYNLSMEFINGQPAMLLMNSDAEIKMQLELSGM